MKHVKTKQLTGHARPMANLSPSDLTRAVGGGIKVPEDPGIKVPEATGIKVPQ